MAYSLVEGKDWFFFFLFPSSFFFAEILVGAFFSLLWLTLQKVKI